MHVCPRCGGRLRPNEKVCFGCGAPVVQEKTNRTVLIARFRMLITGLFFLAAGMTIASLFTDVVPSFMKCMAATVILHFVRSSASQMSED